MLTRGLSVSASKNNMIDNLVRKNVKNLKPYASARSLYQEGVFFDANENALGSTVTVPDVPDLNRYPDPKSADLRKAIAAYVGVDPAQVFVGNGSDEAIDLLIRVFVEPNEAVIIVEPTYGMYKVAAETAGVEIRPWPLTGSFQLDLSSLGTVSAGAKLIFSCSPNNPTGNLLPIEDVRGLCSKFKGIVVLDEAYIEFASQPSLAEKVREIENLVVLRTFSKAWGLAGIRVGYAIAHPKVIGYMDRIKAPYNLGRVSAALAQRALKNKDDMLRMRERILAERLRVARELKEVNFNVFESEANFLLVQYPGMSKIATILAEEYGLIIRDFSGRERLEDCARITIGTPEQNDRLVETLKKIV
ncbi:MAG: Histidinol-phosphate aminotransferase [Candidatus Kaiserbacteria bacterium GW2011_GWA2_58_9]|uniref:Histidinol-phosphate aminotransferase n=2 Tax=Candidatus Kaiseribacteriota TaxID=1752734 RepID=A0A0G2AVN5_9BACT|nr:MAG: Histidinol-phosphate aminotransferase [Candidatus Kaiserbacteria bacterium GW2011_GWA2_58_9]